MLKNSKKIAISKYFLFSFLCVVLIATSFGLSMENAYASDLNQSVDEIGSELNVEDKLGNSQDEILNLNYEDENAMGLSKDEEILGATLNGGTFADIRNAISSTPSGGTIKLSGTFKAEKANDGILVDKKLNFLSDSSATLDGKGISRIFNIQTNAKGSTFKNLILINAVRNSNGAAMNINATDITVSNCIFKYNTGESAPALHTIYDNYSAKNLLVENCQFIQNHATKAAGAIGVFGDNTRVINCYFDSNGASDDPSGIVPYGGAIQIGMGDGTKGYVYNCKFVNNYVKHPTSQSAHGGAGCVRDGIEYKNCIFINNSAAQGGALTYHAGGLIENCTFIDNVAKYFGGALSTGYDYVEMDLLINNCTFEGNVAPIGGAAQLIGEDIVVKNSIFNSNSASQTGGAVNIEAKTVSIEKSSFDSNVANVDGGAIFINGERTIVSDSSFISNDAIPDVAKLDDGLGGAIYINSSSANVKNNEFYFNTARNGSAIYYDKYGRELKLENNTFYQNQAWVYALPIYAHDIYYGETEKLSSIIHGGNNIAKYGDLAVSNAIYNAADNRYLELDNENPVSGATTSGHLYQDDREYNMDILLTVTHEDGTVVYNNTLSSDCFGEVIDNLENLKVGKYYVTANHYEDTYYKAISNSTTFRVTAQVDDRIRKSASSDDINYNDIVVWTLNITNAGPSNATGVVIRDVLPEGLIYISDSSNGDYDPKTGTLTIDFLEVGEIYILTIQTRVNLTGDIVNNANVTANEYDYDITNNHDDSSIHVKSATDLAVVKSVNVTNLDMGDLVRWTITVTNNGPDTATGVVCTDILPKSLIWKNDDSSKNYNPSSGVWNVGTLNKGDSRQLNIVCMVNATGDIKNEVRVSGEQYDYDLSNNYDSKTINVNPSSDLAIEKIVSSSVANYTDVVKWTLIVSNLGPDAASGVKIYDTLPVGFVYVNSSLPMSDGVIDIGDLAVGGRVSVDIYTMANVTGTFVNVASVKGNEYDYNLANNRDDASIYVKPAADLEVVKSVNESSPKYNDLITWTVTVTNNGPDAATGVVVSDVLPESLAFVRSNGNYDNATGKWNIGNLAKGSSVSLNIICRVKATGVIENVVSVRGNEFDQDMSNNNDSEDINVDLASDLAVDKIVDVSVANYTDVVKWTITVTNNGPDAASGVKIYDTLPVGFVYVNSSLPMSGGVIDVGDLIVGGRVSVDVYTRVNVTGTFVNVANVKGNEYDYNLANNRDDASIYIKPAADLEVLKSVNESNPNYADLVTWTVKVTNRGPDAATGVVVSDVLPESLVFVRSNGNYDNATGKWNIGNLAKGSSVSLNIICRVNATGVIENVVSVRGNEFDQDMSNNNDSEEIDVDPSCDLAVDKIVDVSVANYTDVVKWTITVTNNGPDAASGVKIYDALPSGFVYVNSSLPMSGGVIDVGDLAVGGRVSVDIYTRVNVTGNFVNVASVKGNEYDHNLANNRDDASIYIKPATDLTVIKKVNNTYPNYKDNVKWTISVVNNGPDNATGVIVKELLPESLVWIEDNGLGKYNHNSGIWDVGNLKKGEAKTLEIVTFVNATGKFDNIVSVSGNEFDHNKSNNKDNKSIDVANASDVSVIKLVNQTVVNYHQLVKWTIIAHNAGPNKANGVTVDDILPKGLRLINYTATKGFYDEGIWNVCCLEVGDSQTLELICEVIQTGNITNFVKIDCLEYDPDMTNNVDDETVEVPLSSDLAVEKTVDNKNPDYGDIVEWTITVTNRGPDDTNDVSVRDVLNSGLELLSYRATAGSYENGVWNIDSLQKGSSETLILRCLVKTLDDVENIVVVVPSQYDWNMSNNNDSEDISPNPIADLAITKLVNVTTANYLDLIRWTLVVVNYGPNDADGVCVSDVIPKGLSILDVVGDGEFENSVWNIGEMANGDIKRLEIVCKVQATGQFTNYAYVWANQDDPDLENNEYETGFDVKPASDISITKTVSKYRYSVGDLVKFSIKLTNRGPDDAENILVNEIMDDSLVLKSFHARAGDFDEESDVWSIDSLGVGQSALLKIEALASEPGTAKNKVSATSDNYDPDLSNNDDEVVVKVIKRNNSKIPKSHKVTKKNPDTHSKAVSEGILSKNKSGNPLMVLLVLFIFSFGAFCGRNIFKR